MASEIQGLIDEVKKGTAAFEGFRKDSNKSGYIQEKGLDALGNSLGHIEGFLTEIPLLAFGVSKAAKGLMSLRDKAKEGRDSKNQSDTASAAKAVVQPTVKSLSTLEKIELHLVKIARVMDRKNKINVKEKEINRRMDQRFKKRQRGSPVNITNKMLPGMDEVKEAIQDTAGLTTKGFLGSKAGEHFILGMSKSQRALSGMMHKWSQDIDDMRGISDVTKASLEWKKGIAYWNGKAVIAEEANRNKDQITINEFMKEFKQEVTTEQYKNVMGKDFDVQKSTNEDPEAAARENAAFMKEATKEMGEELKASGDQGAETFKQIEITMNSVRKNLEHVQANFGSSRHPARIEAAMVDEFGPDSGMMKNAIGKIFGLGQKNFAKMMAGEEIKGIPVIKDIQKHARKFMSSLTEEASAVDDIEPFREFTNTLEKVTGGGGSTSPEKVQEEIDEVIAQVVKTMVPRRVKQMTKEVLDIKGDIDSPRGMENDLKMKGKAKNFYTDKEMVELLADPKLRDELLGNDLSAKYAADPSKFSYKPLHGSLMMDTEVTKKNPMAGAANDCCKEMKEKLSTINDTLVGTRKEEKKEDKKKANKDKQQGEASRRAESAAVDGGGKGGLIIPVKATASPKAWWKRLGSALLKGLGLVALGGWIVKLVGGLGTMLMNPYVLASLAVLGVLAYFWQDIKDVGTSISGWWKNTDFTGALQNAWDSTVDWFKDGWQSVFGDDVAEGNGGGSAAVTAMGSGDPEATWSHQKMEMTRSQNGQLTDNFKAAAYLDADETKEYKAFESEVGTLKKKANAAQTKYWQHRTTFFSDSAFAQQLKEEGYNFTDKVWEEAEAAHDAEQQREKSKLEASENKANALLLTEKRRLATKQENYLNEKARDTDKQDKFRTIESWQKGINPRTENFQRLSGIKNVDGDTDAFGNPINTDYAGNVLQYDRDAAIRANHMNINSGFTPTDLKDLSPNIKELKEKIDSSGGVNVQNNNQQTHNNYGGGSNINAESISRLIGQKSALVDLAWS